MDIRNGVVWILEMRLDFRLERRWKEWVRYETGETSLVSSRRWRLVA